jgi:hypothetical protein
MLMSGPTGAISIVRLTWSASAAFATPAKRPAMNVNAKGVPAAALARQASFRGTPWVSMDLTAFEIASNETGAKSFPVDGQSAQRLRFVASSASLPEAQTASP